MKTEAFYNCLDLFLKWRQEDEEVLQFLRLVKYPELENTYVLPFDHELGENLVRKPTTEQKSDVIIFYIGQLARTARIRKYYSSIERQKLFDGYPYLNNRQIGSNGYHRDCDIRAHYLYVLLFNEIQVYCNIFHLPFREICKDRFFEMKSISLQTEIYEMGRNFYMERQETEWKSLPKIRPVLNTDLVPRVFEILKDFFTPDQQEALLKIMNTGGETNEPLLFLDNGSILADAFKQLIESNAIKGCQKKDLEAWLFRNFTYRSRDRVKKYTKRYLSDIISTGKDKCKSPILNVIREKGTGNYIISKM